MLFRSGFRLSPSTKALAFSTASARGSLTCSPVRMSLQLSLIHISMQKCKYGFGMNVIGYDPYLTQDKIGDLCELKATAKAVSYTHLKKWQPERAASFLRSLGGAVAFRAERGGKMRRACRSTKGAILSRCLLYTSGRLLAECGIASLAALRSAAVDGY